MLRVSSKEKEKRRKKNRGKLILDATVAPADIKYPTDIDLLNKSREHLETAVNILWQHVFHTGHKLPCSAKKARKSYLKLAKSKKWTQAKCRKAIGEQLQYIRLATEQLEKYTALVPDTNTLFPRWLRDRLAVIPVVYQQQKEMYDNRTHHCQDRIVSLEQPHVRPIQRGKRPNPTEFGQKLHLSVVDGFTYLEQTSWSNFNEGCDLQAAVEDYLRKFGCYPTAVLADKIYQTRTNKLYCKQLGIRLSGPPLGRRKVSQTDAKIKRQTYQDSCLRNAIEGRNGNAKRRFGLDRIFSKLDETAKTEAALILLAMNASLRLARWFALFFHTLLFPLDCLCFSVDPTLEFEDGVPVYVVSKFRSRQVEWQHYDGDPRPGLSIYHGRKASDCLIRIYDKAAERHFFDRHWVRVELQLRDERAQAFAQQVLSGADIGLLYHGVIYNYLRYVDPDPFDSNRWRWPMKGYWSEFLGAAARIRLWQQPGADYNILNCEDFVFRQAGPAIHTLLEIYGTKVFVQKLEEQRGVLSAKYQRLLAERTGRCYNKFGEVQEEGGAGCTPRTQQNKTFVEFNPPADRR